MSTDYFERHLRMESKVIYYSRFSLYGILCTATAGIVTILLLYNNMGLYFDTDYANGHCFQHILALHV